MYVEGKFTVKISEDCLTTNEDSEPLVCVDQGRRLGDETHALRFVPCDECSFHSSGANSRCKKFWGANRKSVFLFEIATREFHLIYRQHLMFN